MLLGKRIQHIRISNIMNLTMTFGMGKIMEIVKVSILEAP